RAADVEVAAQAGAELVPGDRRGQHRNAPVDERAARDVPAIVVVVQVEASDRHQDRAAHQAEAAIRLELEPGLLERQLGVVRALDGELAAERVLRVDERLLELQLPEALELDLDVRPQARRDVRVEGEDEAPERERRLQVLWRV